MMSSFGAEKVPVGEPQFVFLAQISDDEHSRCWAAGCDMPCAAKAGPAAHTMISCFQLPQLGNGPFWAHPVICDGRLYIRHGDVLYAYDVRGQ